MNRIFIVVGPNGDFRSVYADDPELADVRVVHWDERNYTASVEVMEAAPAQNVNDVIARVARIQKGGLI